MKNSKYIIFLLIFSMFAFGCEYKNADTKTTTEAGPEVNEIKTTVPFSERKYIYNNGIKIENKEEKDYDKTGVKLQSNYPVISGLKNKAVQDKLNNEIKENGIKLLSQIEADLKLLLKTGDLKINQKFVSSNILYSCNNVIFVDCFANIEIQNKESKYYEPNSKSASYGYDLNTGNRIDLTDIFKPGIDYKTKINNYIVQYIIENNYDDFEYERMSKPFQGIRENQSFSLNLEGLSIILDEKNDEFVNYGYSEQIHIPLNYFDDDLYIYDRYFDDGKSIYEKEKLNKKLLPNQFGFKADKIIEEGSDKYYVGITQGKFIDLPNKAIEKKLNEMLVSNFDVEGFKKKAAAYKGENKQFHYAHYVNEFLNAGGYLSVAVSDDIFTGDKPMIKRIAFNYDFNENRELKFRDLFTEGADISSPLKAFIRKLNYPISEEMLDKGVAEALNNSLFNFNEYGITFNFSPEGANLSSDQNWISIPIEEIGLENIKLFN